MQIGEENAVDDAISEIADAAGHGVSAVCRARLVRSAPAGAAVNRKTLITRGNRALMN